MSWGGQWNNFIRDSMSFLSEFLVGSFGVDGTKLIHSLVARIRDILKVLLGRLDHGSCLISQRNSFNMNVLPCGHG